MKGSSDRSSQINAMEQSNAVLEENERRRRAALTPEQRAAEDKDNKEREEQAGKTFLIVMAIIVGIVFLLLLLPFLFDFYDNHIGSRRRRSRVGPADGGVTRHDNPMNQVGGRKTSRKRRGKK